MYINPEINVVKDLNIFLRNKKKKPYFSRVLPSGLRSELGKNGFFFHFYCVRYCYCVPIIDVAGPLVKAHEHKAAFSIFFG